MNVFITGGTGLIGRALIDKLLNRSHHVTILTRDTNKARLTFANEVAYCESLDNIQSFDGYDAIVNLAGEPIGDKRWTAKQKQRLCQSRWQLTRKLVALLNASVTAPSVFLSGSAVGYYGTQTDTMLTETSIPNPDFTHYLCQQWETYALMTKSPKTRVCISRTGIVLSGNGGMLPKLIPLFKWGLGSVMGNGNQYISWIHLTDMVNILYRLLEDPQASGVYNVVAPNAVTNKVFSGQLAKSMGKPCFFKIPAWVLYLALGKQATLVVKGQRVVPQKLHDMGYKFAFATIEDAFNDILMGYSKE